MDIRELHAQVERLNSLLGGYFGWWNHQARKSHTDDWGDKIQPGEVYWPKMGGAWGTEPKCSIRSMETMIRHLNGGVYRSVTNALLQREAERFREATKGMWDFLKTKKPLA